MEKQKNACELSFWKAATRSIVHIVAILMTVSLLLINGFEIYFSDLNAYPKQDIVLQAFQFAVKLHEVFMTLSLADMVKHRVRWDLLTKGDVPFGFLTSGFQLADITYIFSSQFWEAAWSFRSPQRIKMACLVFVAVCLTLIVAPASGVLMVPKLNWWPLARPFKNVTSTLFVSNAAANMFWPNELQGYDCGGTLTCPSAGEDTIVSMGSGMMWNNIAAETPQITGGDNFQRWVISNATDYASGWTASTTSMMSVDTNLGGFWNWVSSQSMASTTKLKQPKLSFTWADGGHVFQPLVQVQCSSYSANASLPHIRLPTHQLRIGNQPTTYMQQELPVPGNLSYQGPSSERGKMFWARVPLPKTQDRTPLTAGMMFVLPDDDYTRTVLPCSVLAHWVPTDLIIMPKSDRNIHTSQLNPLDIINGGGVDLTASRQISLSQDWWDTLLVGGDPMYIDNVIGSIRAAVCAGCPETYLGGTQGLSYRVSTLLGVAFADAIARYRPQDTTGVVYQEPTTGDGAFAQDIQHFQTSHPEAPPGYSDWLQYARSKPQEWREAIVTVSRNGYAWSFDGILVKISAGILGAHAVLAVAHVLLVLCGRWSSRAWDSIGGFITMAIGTTNSTNPTNTSVDVRKGALGLRLST